ncbi:hypothetical protein [Weissella viridescens]|uniref:hypothetical protein n=1 Tax=Weissella viridescens TaxID=1629 RepID=UPI003AF2B423
MRKYRVVPFGAYKYATQYKNGVLDSWNYEGVSHRLFDLNRAITFDSEEDAYAHIDECAPGYFKGKHIGKHYTSNFSNQFVNKGMEGQCIREKHVNEVGNLLLVNFGPVSIWCIERDLNEVLEDESN